MVSPGDLLDLARPALSLDRGLDSAATGLGDLVASIALGGLCFLGGFVGLGARPRRSPRSPRSAAASSASSAATASSMTSARRPRLPARRCRRSAAAASLGFVDLDRGLGLDLGLGSATAASAISVDRPRLGGGLARRPRRRRPSRRSSSVASAASASSAASAASAASDVVSRPRRPASCSRTWANAAARVVVDPALGLLDARPTSSSRAPGRGRRSRRGAAAARPPGRPARGAGRAGGSSACFRLRPRRWRSESSEMILSLSVLALVDDVARMGDALVRQLADVDQALEARRGRGRTRRS